MTFTAGKTVLGTAQLSGGVSEADDFVTGCGLDQGHRDILWRLEYFPELSFGDPDGALIGGHVNVVGARSHRKLPCDEQVNDRQSLTQP